MQTKSYIQKKVKYYLKIPLSSSRKLNSFKIIKYNKNNYKEKKTKKNNKMSKYRNKRKFIKTIKLLIKHSLKNI